MSWTAQYQPSYANGQPTFGHPPPLTAPPKPPKKKGNPVITRYPPPPGYRGPAPSRGPFGGPQYPAQYQPSPQVYAQGYQGLSVSQGYPQQYYTASPHQPPHSSYPTPEHSWPQHAQQSYQSAPQPPVNAAPAAFPQQHGYQHFPQQPPPLNTNQQTWPHSQGWSQPFSSGFPASGYNAYAGLPPTPQSAPSSSKTAMPFPAYPPAAPITPVSAKPSSVVKEEAPAETSQLLLASDDWDFDFDGPIWPKANEPVDPNLSLGVIIWRPAKQMTRALPATFEEAEEQSLKPPPDKLGNGESVSLYFTPDNSHEAFLDVRQTDEWDKIKNDPAFVVFTDEDMTQNLVSIGECLALRDRPDEPLEEVIESKDEVMEDTAWNVMDNLEQALSVGVENAHPSAQQPHDAPRDQAQEDILARLGVTGSPKPTSTEQAPTVLPYEHKVTHSLPEKPSGPLPRGSVSHSAFPPALKKSDSSFARKRSYEDIENEDGKAHQQDDHSKRKRRSEVDAAYSRR